MTDQQLADRFAAAELPAWQDAVDRLARKITLPRRRRHLDEDYRCARSTQPPVKVRTVVTKELLNDSGRNCTLYDSWHPTLVKRGSFLQPLQSWQGILALPSLPLRKVNVGGNQVIQSVFPGAQVEARIEPSAHKGHHLLVTRFAPPFEQLLIREKGARRFETSVPVVMLLEGSDPSAVPNILSVHWDSFGELTKFAATPQSILHNWINRFDFRAEDDSSGVQGLRLPQFGALHAIS